jgi:hypothetical protein
VFFILNFDDNGAISVPAITQILSFDVDIYYAIGPPNPKSSVFLFVFLGFGDTSSAWPVAVAPKTPQACQNHEKQLETVIVRSSVSSCFS